ncbi:hypothetical protein AX15_007342 [Amanita polypyramis BW_CC]|nr:hypothetical protein AX15_007342 [Amanita polypyramis BW_CC]
MTSLYAVTWKAFIHSLFKLFWTFILHLRSFSFSFRFGQQSSTTPKPRASNRTEIDLEGGWIPCHPKSNASPSTPLTPTPCFRRPRSNTLCAYTPPDAKLTSRKTSQLSVPTIVYNDIHKSGNAIPSGVAADNRLSDDSLCSFTTAPSAHNEDTEPTQTVVNNARQLDPVLAQEEKGQATSMPEDNGLAKFIVSHRDSRYIGAGGIRGRRLRERVPLPFKSLSPIKTLSLGIGAEKGHRRVSSIPAKSEFQPPRTGSNILLPKLERSRSLDLGLLLLNKSLATVQPRSKDDVLARRPWSTVFTVHDCELLAKQGLLNGHTKAMLVSGHRSNLLVHGRDSLQVQRSRLTGKWKNGSGGESGLHDVSFVKRVLSVMRADDDEQDGQDARNFFNRESIWDYRKSAAPLRVVAKFGSQQFPGKAHSDENDVFVTPSRKLKLSQRCTAKALSIAFPSPNYRSELGDIRVKKRISKARYSSAMPGLNPSPSIQLQLKVEKIKRQRKLRQEMVSLLESTTPGPSARKARETYDWLAEDIQVLDSKLQL